MDLRILIVVLVLSLLCSLSSADELSVSVLEPSDGTFYTSNCPGTSQSSKTRLESKYSVTNPWGSAMTVWYLYYDFGNDEWVEGPSPACTVGPYLITNDCYVQTPLSLGGQGTGVMHQVEYIRLKGVDPDDKYGTLSKTLSFNFDHFESQSETNAIAKLEELRESLDGLDAGGSECYKTFCCGASGDLVEEARTALEEGEAALKRCNLVDAYNLPANALNSLQSVSIGSDQECSSAVLAARESENTISMASDFIDSSNCEIDDALQMLSEAEETQSEILAELEAGNYDEVISLADTVSSLASEAKTLVSCAVEEEDVEEIIVDDQQEPAEQEPDAAADGSPCATAFILPLLSLLAIRRGVR
ncbi:hypothetical protein DRN67_03915 [Candidatus Micrarchaeota archaeon]|nr:MAG: hypothetical protein DRN67_03915 [Candidatus Micrarchaeota archaeon]